MSSRKNTVNDLHPCLICGAFFIGKSPLEDTPFYNAKPAEKYGYDFYDRRFTYFKVFFVEGVGTQALVTDDKTNWYPAAAVMAINGKVYPTKEFGMKYLTGVDKIVNIRGEM